MSKKQETALLPSPGKAKEHLDGKYPGLSGLSYWIGYLEQFLAIISEPLLMVCAAIAVIDFMTGGRLLALPVLTYMWAGSLAMAVTACFIVTWRRAIKAFTLNRYGVSISLALLGSLLGIVDFAAVAVQTLQQTLTISFAQALALLNLNIVFITYTRSAVTMGMAVVVAVSNHTAVTTAQAPKRRLAFLEQALNAVAPVVSSEEVASTDVLITQEPESEVKQRAPKQSEHVHLVETHQAMTPLERVRQALSAEPACSDRRLGKLTRVAAATAKKYRSMIEQERSQAINEAVSERS